MNSTKLPWTARWKTLFLLGAMGLSLSVFAQRSYKLASVLAAGTWYKISVPAEGVYKADVPFLASLGITGSIPAGEIRVFAGANGMLPEAAGESRVDDLEEIAIQVEDGGDGQLNGNDYFLFYSDGPDKWKKDSLNQQFFHQKNRYSDKAFYYITLGGAGKRVQSQPVSSPAAVTASRFDERYFHELDSVNFLSSGREWWGEELSSLPGRSLERAFVLPLADLVPGRATVVTSVAARSVNAESSFLVALNNLPAQQIPVRALGTGPYEVFAQPAEQADNTALDLAGASLQVSYRPGSFNSQGWINWFEFFCRRRLVLGAGKQLPFRDWQTVGNSAVQFTLTVPEATARVWDVTNPFVPEKMNTTLQGPSLQFTNDARRLREYIAFTSAFPVPKSEGRVANQNLHATAPADYLLVTDPAFLPQAQRLADFHRQRDNLESVIVTPTQVFNEFSGGIPDPTAIRDFAKLYFDRYRADWNNKGKYLLLLGKGSFDYKDRIQGNTNLVPVYESPASLDPLATYTSDDFFGFLEDREDINTTLVTNTLDIGIGRIPAKSTDEAKAFVDKLIAYHSPAAYGSWRNNLDFIADDEDQNLHLQDAELVTATVAATAPVFNTEKIYLDAFQQESSQAGGRYPGANAVINSNIYNGTLVWNYTGHGGPQRLAEEVVLDESIVNHWNNPFRLPLFITATCDFATYDNPLLYSLGENLLLRPKTGAIALMTTSRVVFANSNRILNDNYMKVALTPSAGGRYKTLGEAVQASKNLTYTTSGDVVNNRKFSLLGDPAMRLAFPELRVQATKINNRDLALGADTLRAASFVTVDGEVRDSNSVLQPFNGTVYLTVFDKERTVTTLGNDPGSQPVAFPDQSAALFKGKASAAGGRFSFRFRMPRDINFQYGQGKLSLYADDGTKDGNGYTKNVYIGGFDPAANTDNTGPVINAFLNDERFVNGSMTNENPVLILKLTDSSGINTGRSGIDHDIVATLDGNNNEYFVLNNFYESDLDNYQKGAVHFQLPSLSPGSHTLKIKAWDVVNNSSETVLNFTVINNEQLHLAHVLNYPNPFTTQTAFWFEHNYPGVDLRSKVEIFTLSGKLLKTITQTINTPGNRSNELAWDGRDEWGDKVGRGIYVYHLTVKAANGKTAGQWGKMAVLQ
ncbi:type IX secretion system sortase PorU [Flavisolibacter nicotianae]|uniref:type IX secretion system sortase PorU n=1 Tax=Flavisolibacter nicotianae TaxID=2364882 RepID=UPI0013C4FD59|nr:type IX secretion system sortase PorU [Flavisolibacter nicotianae]